MRNAKCDDCGQTFPLGVTFKIAEKILCRPCAEKLLKSRNDIKKEQIQQQHDPTVCVNCGKDNGDTELSKLAGLPACDQCITFLRNRPYPAWIKIAMTGLAAIVVFSFVWNWRFIQAYTDLRSINNAVLARDFETARKLSRSAADNVPEDKTVSAMASFYEAIVKLNEDKSAEALTLLNSCRDHLTPNWGVDELILSAEIGVAFDNKDYDKFLLLAIKNSEKYSNNPNALAQVASAYACKYAVTGDEQFKQQSFDCLQKTNAFSEQQPWPNTGLTEYEDRILHRIETREIIERSEFKKRFPNGWKNRQKEQSE